MTNSSDQQYFDATSRGLAKIIPSLSMIPIEILARTVIGI
ncbi:hypothetical protein Pint_07106 [Pistacia integerrima]|uniref:Uncharacterized protein n=1 Tax=Pistacia integerrima TaxID=434235 RepID=A0ACC0XVK6_9ROSI|nr:hypothetical protein Pint_07106 [Pistacia integerrima]